MTGAESALLSDVSIGTNDFLRALAFYDAVIASLGCRRSMEHPGAVASGRQWPEFWEQTSIDGRPPAPPATTRRARAPNMALPITLP